MNWFWGLVSCVWLGMGGEGRGGRLETNDLLLVVWTQAVDVY